MLSTRRRGAPSSSFVKLLLLAFIFFHGNDGNVFFPSVSASKAKNRAVLQEKYGIDCGTHCTNAVVKLHEAKIEQEKYV
jgi:hypothetical protein|tara:strand:+ start:885 stop:1121 length:237 start_codon:yes stop_codon:yes gene_type:complete